MSQEPETAQREISICAARIKESKIENDLFENPYNYLIEEDEIEEENQKQCPEVNLEIEGIKIRALIDTGSQITCISQDWYDRNQVLLNYCEKLPVVNFQIIGVTKGRPVKVKEQILAKVKIGKLEDQINLLIVNGLKLDVIIGIDTLHRWKADIDLRTNKLSIQSVTNYSQIDLFKSQNENDTNINSIKSVTAKQVKDEDVNYNLTSDEIDKKLEECQVLQVDEIKAFSELLKEYQDIFYKLPGRVTIYEHQLKIYEDKPFVRRSYPVPIMHREKVKLELEKMLKLGVIERSFSEYINPLVVVPKKSGEIRLVLDARFINKLIIPDHDCAQSTEVLFQKCGNTSFMSSLDLTASFWQIPLHPDSRKYTAFMHEGKTYQFTVTPYGLNTSLASLVRTLDLILKRTEEFTVNFVDDILCLSDSVPSHLAHLRKLFETFREYKMTINFEKSKFFREEIDFLGHRITRTGIMPQPDKVEAIKNFPTPKNIKQLKGFLGLTNYYSKFTKAYSETTYPLLALIRKEAKWEWTEKMKEQFQLVKDIFCEEMIIHHPDPKKRYYLQCDASNFAVGAVLYQYSEKDEELVVGFASRTMKSAELNYFTTEKELLAIVFALEKFRSYIIGAKLTIKTDHKALTHLFSCKLVSSRLARWALFIQTYYFDLEYIKGKDNIVADVLSRYPPEKEKENKLVNHIEIIAPLAKEVDENLIEDLKYLKQYQQQDRRIKEIMNSEGIRNSKTLVIIDEILYHKEPGGSPKAFIPESLLKPLIEACHEAYGHVGAAKCNKLLREGFYYPKLEKRIRQAIARCDRCQRCKFPNRYSYAKMQNIIPNGVGDLVSIDFLGPLPASKGNYKWLLVTIDAFSKFVRIYPLKAANAQSTINCIFNKYIPEVGKPKRIQCDHGTQYTSTKWINRLKAERIILIYSSIRHPQGNIVERVNREIGRFFRTFLTDKHTQWINWIRIIESCINEVTHDSTGFTPHEIQLQEKPMRFWKEWIIPKENELTHNAKLCLVDRNIRKHGKRRADRFNRSHKMTNFNIGDLVLVKALNVSDTVNKKMAKFFDLYEGPYKIKRQIGEATYILETKDTEIERGRFHVNMFKPYLEPNQP